MPQLNPEVGIPAVQLVGPETTKEELLELYLEVYKLHRLPGSPPGEPAILKEVLSSLLDHQRCEEEEGPTAMAWPHAEGSHSSRSCTPHTGRKDDSVERSLAMVCESHQKVLAAVATLEEEIERLSHIQAHSQSRSRSKSWDCQRKVERGKRGGITRFGLKINLPPAVLLTLKQNVVSRGPMLKALTWRSCQN